MSQFRISDLEKKGTVNTGDLFMISDANKNSSISIDFESLARNLWQMMYVIPVIMRCGHCGSHNVITNSNCIQCGAPAGNFVEISDGNK